MKQFNEIDIGTLLSTKADLHPDLVPYVYDISFGMKALQHPLCYSVPYNEQMNALLNHQYETKTKAAIEAIEKENWMGYLTLVERPYRVTYFYSIVADNVDSKSYWSILSWVYSDSENIHQNFDLWGELLNADIPNRECFMDRTERELFDKLPDVIEIYRGYNAEYEHWEGYSWTTELKTAEWFAKRFNSTKPRVVFGNVNKRNVIGYLIHRNESEIVCDTENVSILKFKDYYEPL